VKKNKKKGKSKGKEAQGKDAPPGLDKHMQRKTFNEDEIPSGTDSPAERGSLIRNDSDESGPSHMRLSNLITMDDCLSADTVSSRTSDKDFGLFLEIATNLKEIEGDKSSSDFDERGSDRGSFTERNSSTPRELSGELSVVLEKMKHKEKGIKLKEKKVQSKKYSAFTGQKAITWLVDNKIAKSREEARQLGNDLMHCNVRLIFHIDLFIIFIFFSVLLWCYLQ
tara:strand:+ start:160 stop:831 length:672 start_codon:yes stop_codon:yes gene_type:complete